MPLLDEAIDYVNSLFGNNAGGHDAEHTLRVYHNAMLIAEHEPDCDLETVALSALLHDADDHKLFSTENNANARSFLTLHNVEPDKIDRICKAINAVSFSQNRGKHPESMEHGRSLEASIQHFQDKLLLLRDEMNTETAKKLAESRHRFMVDFLHEFDEEIKTAYPKRS